MIVTGDFETYYDKEYSLSRMSEAEYVLDDRYQTIMLALKRDAEPSRTYLGHDAVARALSEFDWNKVAWLSHNTRFDGSILAWRFGYMPKLYLDTLSMARAVTHWLIGKSSLKAVSDYLGLPPKGDEVVRALGKHLTDFTPDELAAYQSYCMRDNDNCYEIYQALRGHVPRQELRLIDLILRMFIMPQVQLDDDLLESHLVEVRAEKQQALEQVQGIDKEHFSSNTKFAALLAHYGVVVPTKTSPHTGEEIPALARGDWDFKELCADPANPPFIQTLLATRLSVKSTIDETRAENLLRLSRVTWPTQGRAWAPVPLKYSGALTHRLSGDGGINFQNIRRGSSLRKALVAPTGYRIVHRDASQIEARMVAWMAGCKVLVDDFAAGVDVYSVFASTIYHRPITRADKMERFVGKTGILGLGYACGAARFRHMLFIGVAGLSLKLSVEEAQVIVDTYRGEYWQIPELWRAFDSLLHAMAQHAANSNPTIAGLPIAPSRDDNAIWLPNETCICYPGLRYEYSNTSGREFRYNDPYGGRRKIYGAKVVENISQALSRIVVTDIARRVYGQTGYHPWLSTHDSLDYCVPVEDAAWLDEELARQFTLVPDWGQGLPLASEGGWGRTLSDAEKEVNL